MARRCSPGVRILIPVIAMGGLLAALPAPSAAAPPDRFWRSGSDSVHAKPSPNRRYAARTSGRKFR